jgi:hypothetical protein
VRNRIQARPEVVAEPSGVGNRVIGIVQSDSVVDAPYGRTDSDWTIPEMRESQLSVVQQLPQLLAGQVAQLAAGEAA